MAVRLIAFVAVSSLLSPRPATAGEDYAKLPANTWTLVHAEDNSGGKTYAKLVWAESVGRLYLWGTGGKKPARNVYLRYELESFDPAARRWRAAFPAARRGRWTQREYPPFRIWGQSGPDGLKYHEGPRLQCVGGFNYTNRVRWWDFGGVKRPSPVLTFNMACWDSRRKRIVYFSDGQTFALDPATDTWTDLKPGKSPTTCATVAWASMCYDPAADNVLLFGGGMATNPAGGAPTWLYDCRANRWRRPGLDVEPPLRCNAPIVYDPAGKVMVMFGGYDQSAALNDTWIWHGDEGRWEHRRPPLAPPPMYAPAAAVVPGGEAVLVCGNDGRTVRLNHQVSSSAVKQTWVYDVAANRWTPVHDGPKLSGCRWLTAASSKAHGVVFMAAFGPERRTYAFRYDAKAAPAKLGGAPPDRVAWKYPEQKLSLEQAPPPDRAAVAKRLASLPANTFVDAAAPGLLISKTWSSAVMDSDRGEVLYIGGGHCGYSGNDFARYRIADNRWGLDFPPRFPPFLEGTNAGLFGWSYGLMPFSQHTYLWYCYDPASKTVLYLARQSLRDGVTVRLTDDPGDTFVYSEKKHGQASWVYDPAARKMRRPSFGRPFGNPWHLSLVGTPNGVYAASGRKLYHAKVDRAAGRVDWTLIDPTFPKPREKIKYHYEFQPLLHDTRRDRLIQLKGDASRVDVYARPRLPGGKWRQLETAGAASIGREAVYVASQDTVLWLDDGRLFAFDCAAGRLGELDVSLPEGRYGHECAFVHAAGLDVCVGLIPSRFSGPMQTMLFRFDAKAARYKPPARRGGR